MEIYKEFVVFPSDYKKSIAFLSTKDVAKSWTFDVDWKFPLIKAKPKMFLESGGDAVTADPELAENEESEKLIQNLAVSEANNLLAFATNEKSLFLCKIQESSAVILSRRCFLRTSSVMKFSTCGKFLFFADKTGDTFEYSCEDVDKPARWILGHISQILDLTIKSDLKCIVTSDRDEKIKVSNYPATHEIEALCIGHKQFVPSSVFFNNEQLLLSASGDKTLRFWDFTSGKQVQLIELSFVPITIVLLEELKMIGFESDDNSVYIFKYNIEDEGKVKLNLLGEKNYSNPVAVKAQGNQFLILHTLNSDEKVKLLLDNVVVTEKTATFEALQDVSKSLRLNLEASFKILKLFDIPTLFKNNAYDNVKQYIDRKRARIENQKK